MLGIYRIRRGKPCCHAKSWKPISKKRTLNTILTRKTPTAFWWSFRPKRCPTSRSILNSRTVLFLSRLPLSVPPEHRAAVCEYITRVNYSVVLGGFEMNLDEGDVNYKIVGALGRENEIDREAFCRLLYLGNSMLDKYAPGILAILYGGKTAAEAYQSFTKSNN